jgi:hypothetical protein
MYLVKIIIIANDPIINMETDKILLFYLTVPPALAILLIVLYELNKHNKIRMDIIFVLGLLVYRLFERRNKQYQKAMKEITLHQES